MSFGDRPWDGKTEKELNQEVAVRTPVAEVSGFEMRPRTLDEAMEFCRIMADSELVAPSYRNKPGNVMVAIQMGQELGMSPMRSLRSIAVINGRAAMWGDDMLAMVLASPLCEYVRENECTDAQGVCTVKRKTDAEPYTYTFTLANAKTAGLLGKQGPWQTSTKRMLQLRARGFALRDKFTDVLAGLVSAEEALDLPRVEPDDPKVNITLEAAQPLTLKDRLKAKIEQTIEATQDDTRQQDDVAGATLEHALASPLQGNDAAAPTDDPATPYLAKIRTAHTATEVNAVYAAIPEELKQDCHTQYFDRLKALGKKK